MTYTPFMHNWQSDLKGIIGNPTCHLNPDLALIVPGRPSQGVFPLVGNKGRKTWRCLAILAPTNLDRDHLHLESDWNLSEDRANSPVNRQLPSPCTTFKAIKMTDGSFLLSSSLLKMYFQQYYEHLYICAQHGHVGYPWKEHKKCSSETFTWRL